MLMISAGWFHPSPLPQGNFKEVVRSADIPSRLKKCNCWIAPPCLYLHKADKIYDPPGINEYRILFHNLRYSRSHRGRAKLELTRLTLSGSSLIQTYPISCLIGSLREDPVAV